MENILNPPIYYFSENGNVQGPFELDSLVQKISADTLIFEENGIKWVKAEEIPVVMDALIKYQESVNRISSPLLSESLPRELSNDEFIINTEKIQNQEIHDEEEVLTPSQKSVTTDISAHPAPSSSTGSPRLIFLVPLTLLLFFGGLFSYLFLIKPYLKDKNAARKYCFIESLVVRSSKIYGVEYNVIDNCNYGNELLVYEDDGMWATCKFNNKECFVASKFLLSKEDFHLLHSIFTDVDTREAVPTAKCRIALLDYYKRNSLMGYMDSSSQIQIFGKMLNFPIWILTARKKNLKPNTIIYPRVVDSDSKFTDFGCLIQNASNGNRKFLLFSFTDDERPILQSDQDAPQNGLVKGVYKNYGWDGVQYYVNYSF
ncbi:MAG: DUF4339 domain-containing protein [Bacteroidetes bacterium]|nr:DUF4339 domain-containing protein [Bacteroidota bacterium]